MGKPKLKVVRAYRDEKEPMIHITLTRPVTQLELVGITSAVNEACQL